MKDKKTRKSLKKSKLQPIIPSVTSEKITWFMMPQFLNKKINADAE